MTKVTIADRRAVMARSTAHSEFRELLQRDARAAFERATGRPAPTLDRITVIEEQGDAWEFVLPAGAIDAQLPEPDDARGVIENNVYEILRDEPGVRADAIRNPRAFLAERLQFKMNAAVNVREEQPGELLLILPYGDSRDELTDSALDLVAGGGVNLANGPDQENYREGGVSNGAPPKTN